MLNKSATILFLLLLTINAFAQRELGNRPTETGGPVPYEQAAYDVKKYDISIKVNIPEKSISGATIVTAKIVQPINVFVLDLDTPFTVSKVTSVETKGETDLKFERKGGKIWSYFPLTKQAGETVSVKVVYAGVPRVAPRPPWVGGFMWEKTADGSPWVVTALQNDGADLMFPCKDYPSDKAETVATHVTVPNGLYVATAGKLQKVDKNSDGTQTYNWLMSTPIANYGIALNIAPYKVIEDSMKSISGETIPIKFYILPESYAKGASLIAETKKYVAFFEEYLGPFPFRAEKLGIVETPHLGMEHSTIIAYGNKFKYDKDGFDWLMFHEFGHEWWANLVTASDWRDFWIHEGFQSFMDTLYVEKTKGQDAYLAAMRNRARNLRNKQPVAPREAKIAYQVYMAEPNYVNSDGDIYGKGACILNTLRYLLGDKVFFRALRRMSYPTKEMEKLTDGRQSRFVNTDDFLRIAEEESGMKLDWFFEVYLRQPALPKLVKETNGDRTDLHWETPNNLPFSMPIDVEIDGKIQRVEMKDGKGVVMTKGVAPKIDPKGWVLKAE
ncbi:MAG TPA: M1 family metallopeptidase [Pyrinomonadaceae bacterium]|nr:M1 family metallopeptidase [Pyrinomonadaceae bacterium]